MKITRRKFLKAGTSALAVSAGVLLAMPEITKGQNTRITRTATESVPNKAAVEAFDTITNLNKVDFINQLGTRFNLVSEEYGSKTVTLVEVQDLAIQNTDAGKQTVGFSLAFRGKRRQAVNQDTYLVSHPTLGTFQLLLAPVLFSQSDPTLCYEAIICRYA